VVLAIGHRRVAKHLLGAYLGPGPGERWEHRQAAPGAVPEPWRGREGALERVLAVGRALLTATGMSAEELVGMRLAELDTHVRRGYVVVGGQARPLDIALLRLLRRLRETEFVGLRYPWRMRVAPGEAVRLLQVARWRPHSGGEQSVVAESGCGVKQVRYPG